MPDQDKQAPAKPTKLSRAWAMAQDRYALGRDSYGPYAQCGDVKYRPSARGQARDLLRADLRAAWRAASANLDDPPGSAILDAVIADLLHDAAERKLDEPTSDEIAAMLTAGVIGDDRLQVGTVNRNPFDTAREVADHLLAENKPPRIFRMGTEGTAVVQVLDDGTLLPLDKDQGSPWLTYVAERVTFLGSDRIIAPTSAVMRMLPVLMLPDLPVLDGMATSPYLDSTGALVTDDGYHAGSHLYLRSRCLDLPSVSEAPSAKELTEARRLLLDEWLQDFPFVSDADRANAIALPLTLTGREFVGLCPMFVNDASASGSGKGLLTDTQYIIAAGDTPELLELSLDKEEQRKAITSALLEGKSLLAWDESPIIEGRSLARILTAEVYADRLLGRNKKIAVRNRFTHVAIGNNCDVRGDMKRRVLPARLVPDCEHPERRTGFRHPHLKQWVRDNRGLLLWAVLTIWRHWDVTGRQPAGITIGSFERWGRSVGGALAQAGIPGFAENLDQWLSFSEHDDGWSAHLTQLRRMFATGWFSASEVAVQVQAAKLPRPPIRRDPDKDLALLIGYAYRSVRERPYGPLRLVRSAERDSEHGAYRWRVVDRDRPADEQ